MALAQTTLQLSSLAVAKAALLAGKALLTKVLTDHVIPDLLSRADVPVNTSINSLQGNALTLDSCLKATDQRGRKSGNVATDLLAKNGVI